MAAGARPYNDPTCPHGLAVRTPAFHAGDRRFDSGWGYLLFRLEMGVFSPVSVAISGKPWSRFAAFVPFCAACEPLRRTASRSLVPRR